MAYHFSAEKSGSVDMQRLHEQLSVVDLIEFFPIDISDESLTVGITIPLRAMNAPRFKSELAETMRFLISVEGFQVTDLYTGKLIAVDEIPNLAQQIAT